MHTYTHASERAYNVNSPVDFEPFNFSRADVPLIINFAKGRERRQPPKWCSAGKRTVATCGPDAEDDGIRRRAGAGWSEECRFRTGVRRRRRRRRLAWFMRTAQEVGVLACFPSVEYCNRRPPLRADPDTHLPHSYPVARWINYYHSRVGDYY